MADPPARSALRTLSLAAVERVRESGLSIDRFRGIAFYDTAKDEIFTALDDFQSAEQSLVSVSLLPERYGVGEVRRLMLQFMYQLLARLGDVARYTGRLSETEQLLGRAIEEFREHGDLLGAGEAMVTLVLALWRLGRADESRQQVLAEAIELLEQEAPGEQLVRAYARAATDSQLSGRLIDSHPTAMS